MRIKTSRLVWALTWLTLAGCGQAPSVAQSPPPATHTPSATTPTPSPSVGAPSPSEVANPNIYPGGPPAGLQHLTAPVWGYRVKNRYPHDPTAFTQGLLVGPDGYFSEGTGLNGHSEVRQEVIESGKVLKRVKVDKKYFGEGLAKSGERLIEITWQSGEALVYDFKTFKPLERWRYEGEGWGLLEHDGKLLMSNGSAQLNWRDPKDFHVVSSLNVTDGGQPVTQLNELEWIDGQIWANVWQSDYIAVIDPKDGVVKAWIDMSGLLSPTQAAHADVLNGIALDPKGHRIFITGKFWPTVFEIETTH